MIPIQIESMINIFLVSIPCDNNHNRISSTYVDPGGVMLYSKSGTPIVCYKIPKDKIKDKIKQNPIVYTLVGIDEGKHAIYVGKTEGSEKNDYYKRFTQHEKEKSFLEYILVFDNTGYDNFTDSDVRYLEILMYDHLYKNKSINTFKFINDIRPKTPILDNVRKNELERYFKDIKEFTKSIVGFKIYDDLDDVPSLPPPLHNIDNKILKLVNKEYTKNCCQNKRYKDQIGIWSYIRKDEISIELFIDTDSELYNKLQLQKYEIEAKIHEKDTEIFWEKNNRGKFHIGIKKYIDATDKKNYDLCIEFFDRFCKKFENVFSNYIIEHYKLKEGK